MSKRKILILAMSLCMVAILAVGGSLAYFTDNDRETNTFTIGNVDIEIDEWMENEDGEWVEYEDQILAPIAHGKTTYNKLVETVNVGKSSAYIRTFVTCPKDMYDLLGLGFNSGSKAVIGKNDDNMNMYPVTWKDVGTFMINGEETAVFLCEVDASKHKTQIVAPGESVLSLTKVWLYDETTNEDVKEFDLANGMFKVEVASQAIQSDNLTYTEAMAELGTIDQALMDTLFPAKGE